MNSKILKLMVASLSLVLFIAPTNVKAEGIEYKIVDTAILNHSKHGKGIEMRIKPSSMPEGGLTGDILLKAIPNICKFYAPKVIPFVTKKSGFTNPEFIAVRVI